MLRCCHVTKIAVYTERTSIDISNIYFENSVKSIRFGEKFVTLFLLFLVDLANCYTFISIIEAGDASQREYNSK